MPRSQQPSEGEQLIVVKLLAQRDSRVLDIGCGDGKWSELLFHKVAKLDGLEVWLPYINTYDLRSKYDTLYNIDMRHFETFENYNVVILGDVLEHIPYNDAVQFINKLKRHSLTVYLIIPISLCIQDGTVYGNPHETHVYQWTHEELKALGFSQIHVGYNPNGLVKIGTYELICGGSK